MKRLVLYLAVLLLACLVGGCSQSGGAEAHSRQNEEPNKELTVENCRIATEWYECSYPEALSEVICVEKMEGEFTGDLEFYADMADCKQRIFDLMYDDDQGDWTIEYENAAGKKIKVSFVMYKIPDGLSESDEMTFAAAQEAVNDIVSTLKLK